MGCSEKYLLTIKVRIQIPNDKIFLVKTLRNIFVGCFGTALSKTAIKNQRSYLKKEAGGNPLSVNTDTIMYIKSDYVPA